MLLVTIGRASPDNRVHKLPGWTATRNGVRYFLMPPFMQVVDTLPGADVREFAQVVTKRRGGKLGHLQGTQSQHSQNLRSLWDPFRNLP